MRSRPPQHASPPTTGTAPQACPAAPAHRAGRPYQGNTQAAPDKGAHPVLNDGAQAPDLEIHIPTICAHLSQLYFKYVTSLEVTSGPHQNHGSIHGFIAVLCLCATTQTTRSFAALSLSEAPLARTFVAVQSAPSTSLKRIYTSASVQSMPPCLFQVCCCPGHCRRCPRNGHVS